MVSRTRGIRASSRWRKFSFAGPGVTTSPVSVPAVSRSIATGESRRGLTNANGTCPVLTTHLGVVCRNHYA